MKSGESTGKYDYLIRNDADTIKDDLKAMAGVKRAFDPGGRFNPEKVFPKGYLCGDVLALATQFEAHAALHGIHPM